MSRPIDEKITKMTLDNTDFMSRVSQTIQAFNRLLSATGKLRDVSLDKTTNAMNGIAGAVDKVRFGKLASGIAGVQEKFSAMSVVAITALQNITNRAINAGSQLIKSFTMEPITAGFAEYEDKMNAIQVILSNTQGKSSLDDVKASLADLNEYSDKTIYSFQDMTRNMGTFTAAGVGLKDAQTAMKGIGNLAAVSGSNTQQAGTAMYQLSQAIAAGKVGLQDWNSVVNAGMGGKKFQDALKANAKGFWDGADASLSFRDSLQEGWLTADVLMKTLGQFAEDDSMLDAATKVRTFSQLMDTTKEALQSGWSETWEIVFGDFEESGEMWTQVGKTVGDFISNFSKARNDLLRGFDDLGGRKVVIEGLTNVFNGLVAVAKLVGDSFRKMFPPQTAQGLMNLANGFRDFTKQLQPSQETAAKLSRIFDGVFALASSGIIIIKRLGQTFLKLIPEGTSAGLLDLLAKLGDLSVKFNESLKSGKAMQGSFKALSFVISGVSGVFGLLFGVIAGLPDTFDEVFNTLMNYVGPAIDKISSGFKTLTKDIDGNDLANGGLAVAILVVNETLKKFKNILSEGLDTFFGKLNPIENIKDTLDALGESLQAFTANIKVNMLLKIAAAVGILAISLKILSTIDSKDAIKSLELLGVTMAALTITFGKVTAIASQSKGLLGASVALVAIGIAIGALAVSLKILESIDPEALGTSLLSLAVIMGLLVASMKSLSKLKGVSVSTSVAMGIMAGSIIVLAGAVYVLSKIDSGQVVQGLAALGAIFAEIAIFSNVMKKAKIGPGTALGMVIITGAIISMSATAVALGQIDVNTLVKGLSSIGAMLLGISVFAKLMKNTNFAASATGMAILAGAIAGLALPVMQFGAMDINSIVKGLGALAGIMTVLAVAMKATKGSASSAIGISLMAGAMLLLVPSFVALSHLSLPQIGAGLLAMAGAFTVIGVAAAILGPIAVTSLIPFAGALLMMGVSVASVGLGLMGIAAALTSLAALSTGAILTILANINSLLAGLTPLIPTFVTFVVTLVTQMAWGVATAAPQLLAAFMALISGVLSMLNIYLPTIVTKGMELVTNLLNGIAIKLPDLIAAAANLISTFMIGLGENAPQMIEAGTKMMLDFINGIANTLREHSQELVGAAMNIMEAILEVMVDGLVAVVNVLFGWIPGFENVTGSLGDSAKGALRDAFNVSDTGAIGADGAQGAVDGIESKTGDAENAGTDVMNAGKDGLGSGDASGEGRDLSGGFTDSILDKRGAAESNASSVAQAGKGGFESVSAESSGTNFGQGFANGISGMLGTVERAASGLANSAKGFVEKVLAIFSPSRVMRKDGGYFGEGFALGIEDKERRVGQASGSMGQVAIDAMKGVGDHISDALDNEIGLTPVITPVVDTSNIRAANGLFTSAQYGYGGFGQQQPITVNTPIDMSIFNAILEQLGELAEQDYYFQIDIDGKTFTRAIANPMKDAIDRIDEAKAIIATGRRN